MLSAATASAAISRRVAIANSIENHVPTRSAPGEIGSGRRCRRNGRPKRSGIAVYSARRSGSLNVVEGEQKIDDVYAAEKYEINILSCRFERSCIRTKPVSGRAHDPSAQLGIVARQAAKPKSM
jgi:hypothetical protein